MRLTIWIYGKQRVSSVMERPSAFLNVSAECFLYIGRCEFALIGGNTLER